MAQRVLTLLVDDLDGESVAAETVGFALDGTQYDIDLTEANAADLRSVLNGYIDAARNATPKPPNRRRVAPQSKQVDAGRADLNAIRVWARQNGKQVSDRGRVSGSIMQEYEAAHR